MVDVSLAYFEVSCTHNGQATFVYVCSLGWEGWVVVVVAERAVEAVGGQVAGGVRI